MMRLAMARRYAERTVFAVGNRRALRLARRQVGRSGPMSVSLAELPEAMCLRQSPQEQPNHPEPRVVRLEDGVAVMDNRIGSAILTRDGRAVRELSITPLGVDPSLITALVSDLPLQVHGRMISGLAGAGHDTNYWHWLFDVLPRISAAGSNGESVGGCTVLVPYNDRRFQRETLEMLGVSPVNIVNSHIHRRVQAEELLATTGPLDHGVAGWVVDCVRQSVLPEARPPQSVTPRIYIRRGDAEVRQLRNEREVEQLLTLWGFSCLDLSAFLVREQAGLMAQAECVIGPHGAALTNIAFVRPGTCVIELVSTAWQTPVYEELAASVGAQYLQVPLRARRVPLPRKMRSEADTFADIQALEDDLRQILGPARV